MINREKDLQFLSENIIKAENNNCTDNDLIRVVTQFYDNFDPVSKCDVSSILDRASKKGLMAKDRSALIEALKQLKKEFSK